MRLIKMFGLAAIAACAFMAFLGATSASAITSLEQVVLCKTDPVGSDCPEKGHFLSGTGIHGELVKEKHATLLAGLFGNILCTGSTVKGKTTELLAHGEITSVAFTGCTHFGEACVVTAENVPYLALAILNETHSGYHLTVSKLTLGPPKAHVVCPGVDCFFSTASALFNLILGTEDVVAKIEQELTREGGFCPSTSKWDAEYLLRCLEGEKLVPCWPKMHFGSKLTTP